MDASTIGSGEKSQIPAAANLANWSSREWTDGVQINEMNELEMLTVQTLNSVYEITVLSGHTGEILVRGGKFFPEWTPAQLSGASFGGSFLKLRGVYVGLKIEFLHDGQRIVTSRVCRIITSKN
jgi:hypothetical protein